MMELIDRRKLVSDFWKGVEDASILSFEDTDELMEKAPTVDAVEVVHGRWIEKLEPIPWCEDDVDVYTVCSVCESYSPGESNYCPNCGAKMDGERKDNEHP